jgi:hypothetical protein
MRFPLHQKLHFPCVFERMVPGRLHPDGRRYLPLILLRPTAPAAPEGLLLGVVDRHHRVREADLGQAGSAALVWSLSTLRSQEGEQRRELKPEPGWRSGQPSLAPIARGAVLEVAAWEVAREELPFERLYAELLLDIGLGVVGLRTGLTAPSLAHDIGVESVQPGDYLELSRSRIDVLGFTPG